MKKFKDDADLRRWAMQNGATVEDDESGAVFNAGGLEGQMAPPRPAPPPAPLPDVPAELAALRVAIESMPPPPPPVDNTDINARLDEIMSILDRMYDAIVALAMTTDRKPKKWKFNAARNEDGELMGLEAMADDSADAEQETSIDVARHALRTVN